MTKILNIPLRLYQLEKSLAEIIHLESNLFQCDLESLCSEQLEERLKEFEGENLETAILQRKSEVKKVHLSEVDKPHYSEVEKSYHLEFEERKSHPIEVEPKELNPSEVIGKETHQSMLEVPRIHHRQPRSSPRPPNFSSTRPDDTMDASQMEIKNIPSLVQSLSEHLNFANRIKAKQSFDVNQHHHSPPHHLKAFNHYQVSIYPVQPQSKVSHNQTFQWLRQPRKSTIQHKSLDDCIDKLIPYQETVIPHKHRSDMTLEESLLRLEHRRDVPQIELL